MLRLVKRYLVSSLFMVLVLGVNPHLGESPEVFT